MWKCLHCGRYWPKPEWREWHLRVCKDASPEARIYYFKYGHWPRKRIRRRS